MIDTAQAFGVDIGGSGIKAAPVNLEKGEFAEPRYKILTPAVSTPQAVADIVRQQLEHFEVPADVPVGIAFPAQLSLVRSSILWQILTSLGLVLMLLKSLARLVVVL